MKRVRSVPPLVRKLTDQTAETADRMAVELICNGTGTVAHLDRVLTISHLLRFAADHKKDGQAINASDMADFVLTGLVERYKRTGRVGATGEEAKALRALVDYSEDFWRRQSGALRDACVDAINRWYGDIDRDRKNLCDA
jgi:hypothetical protein